MAFTFKRSVKISYKIGICVLFPLLLAPMAFGQEDYVGRYDVYGGYLYLSSPIINLGESGIHTQIGINPTKWYSLGFDFSAGSGDTILTTNMMKPSMQQVVAAQLAPFKAAGLLPANYEPVVPLHSQSETYAAGPQFNYRHFRAITLFAHPDLGAIHEAATPHPGDAIGKALVMQLAPSGIKRDWTYFYGFGGGVDVNLMRHFGLRVTADFVRDHLFSDLLNFRNSVRFSVGPAFHFGGNVAK
jgi:hypothetical protein